MVAHSSPGQSPWITRGESVRMSTPRASASRLAGSIVTTTVLRPLRAPSSATAAAIVVLPTPPVPVQMTIWAPATTRSSAVIAGPGRASLADGLQPADPLEKAPGQPVDVAGTNVGGEQIRQVQLGQRETGREPAELLLLQRDAVATEGGGLGQYPSVGPPQAPAGLRRRIRWGD